MKIFITIALHGILCIASIVSATGSYSIHDLAWLTGCWANVGGEPGSGEQWTSPAGKTMFGVNRTVRNSETTAYEFMQIREIEGGKITFIAKPSGQNEATFAIKELSEREVVFENPDHDFPQSITYFINTDGNLEARIEGLINGKLRTVTFLMRRVDCLSISAKP